MGVSPEKFQKIRCLLEFVPKIFETYQGHLKSIQKKNYSMIDIGTGPGTMLLKIESLLPKQYKEIICADRAATMIEYFTAVPKDPKITSRLLDISDDKIPEDLKGRFDFAFSSFCFGYVSDLSKTFQNSNLLLKRDGETFFTWTTRSLVYEVFRSLSKIEKWAPYTNDFKNWKSLSEHDDPVGTVQSHIEAAGLETVKIVEYKDFTFDDPVDVILGGYESQDHLMHRIPKIDQRKYREDFNRIVSTEHLVIQETSEGKKSIVPMPAIVVITRKHQMDII